MKFRLIVVFLLCWSVVKAQKPGDNITPSRLKAAEDVLTASGAGEQMKENIATMIKQASDNVPDEKKARFNEIMSTFMNKYMNWDLLKDQMAALYAQEFTEKELKDLTSFYLSPLGKKLNQKQPLLFQKVGTTWPASCTKSPGRTAANDAGSI